jgi:hypothetical protein
MGGFGSEGSIGFFLQRMAPCRRPVSGVCHE